MNELIKAMYQTSIDLIKEIYDLSLKHNLTNSQEFLNWQDELNEYSVI